MRSAVSLISDPSQIRDGLGPDFPSGLLAGKWLVRGWNRRNRLRKQRGDRPGWTFSFDMGSSGRGIQNDRPDPSRYRRRAGRQDGLDPSPRLLRTRHIPNPEDDQDRSVRVESLYQVIMPGWRSDRLILGWDQPSGRPWDLGGSLGRSGTFVRRGCRQFRAANRLGGSGCLAGHVQILGSIR